MSSCGEMLQLSFEAVTGTRKTKLARREIAPHPMGDPAEKRVCTRLRATIGRRTSE